MAAAGVTALRLGAADDRHQFRFRLAMCNETYEKKPFADTCRAIRKVGYTGIEIAPFTLSDDPNAIPAGERREYASIIRSEGLTFAGLHWLLLVPKGLQVTTHDGAVRARSWEHMRRLIDFCADLGPGGVMTLGSPKQRAVEPGMDRADAVKHFTDGLAGIAPHAVERSVKVLIETFTQFPDDIARSMAEAVAMVRQIGSPGIQTMFDTNNASNEAEPHATLVDRYFNYIHHVHLTEKGGAYPGTGTYDFKPVLRVLRRRGYTGWLSLEVFDFRAGADKIAQDSLRYLQGEIARLG
ncbi:MAG TPA: sugar phosphate isomerase/epimerase family protein [Bryobacteraceae bacterium]|nr:sugar phosphate isomerase/epimerase family protein [Bryobacteraceae bacterium]